MSLRASHADELMSEINITPFTDVLLRAALRKR